MMDDYEYEDLAIGYLVCESMRADEENEVIEQSNYELSPFAKFMYWTFATIIIIQLVIAYAKQ